MNPAEALALRRRPQSMTSETKSRPSRGYQPMRRFALMLGRLGVTSETIALSGMVCGIFAGAAFFLTSVFEEPFRFWIFAAAFCLLRIVTIRLDAALQGTSQRTAFEEHFFSEVPERVSDAVTLIGFGFALGANHWLGLAAALAAILSAYMRALGVRRGAARKSAASGPMTRTHRLVLLFLTAMLIVSPLPSDRFDTPVPIIALWVIIVGCLVTILVRWLNMRETKG